MEIDLNPSGQIIQEALGCYEYVVRNRAPYCHRDPFLGPDGQIETEDIVYLPLAGDGDAVAMILVFSHCYNFRRRTAGSAM